VLLFSASIVCFDQRIQLDEQDNYHNIKPNDSDPFEFLLKPNDSDPFGIFGVRAKFLASKLFIFLL
jgi:hypothetical protein